MNNGSSSKCQDEPKKIEKSKKLKEGSAEETVEHKQVPLENENPKTEAKEEKGSHGTSDKKDKKEKSIGRCKKCKAKAKMMMTKLKEEEDEKQKPKTDSKEEKGSKATTDVKAEKEKAPIITWRHKSTKKDKNHGKNLFNANPPYQTASRSMYQGGPNFSNPWNMYAPPRVMYPAFAKGPMSGQCGGGGPFQPYQPMNPAAMYRGAIMSPYPPMAAAPPAMYPPYWQSRPFTDANPITRYTTYRDNYSYFLI